MTPLPGGHLARKLGGAMVIGVAVCVNGLLTLFTPLAARMHVGMFIALRIAIGLAQVKTDCDCVPRLKGQCHQDLVQFENPMKVLV